MDGGAWWAAVHGVMKSRTRLSDFPFTFHFPALEKEMATHSSVLAWRIPGTGEPGGLQSMGSHRVGHDWRDLAAAAAALQSSLCHVCVDGTFRGWTHLLVTSNQRWTKKFFQKLINVLSMLLWFWYSIKNTVEYIIWLWNVDHQMDSCKISGSGELNTY